MHGSAAAMLSASCATMSVLLKKKKKEERRRNYQIWTQGGNMETSERRGGEDDRLGTFVASFQGRWRSGAVPAQE